MLTTKLTIIDLVNHSSSDCNMEQCPMENLKNTEKDHFIVETAKLAQLIAEQKDEAFIQNKCCKGTLRL